MGGYCRPEAVLWVATAGLWWSLLQVAAGLICRLCFVNYRCCAKDNFFTRYSPIVSKSMLSFVPYLT